MRPRLCDALTTLALGLTLLVPCAAPAHSGGGGAHGAATAKEGGSRLVQMIPTYRTVMADPQYHLLLDQLGTHPTDGSVRDRLLSYLPISPLDMMKVKMFLGRYETMIPPVTVALHRRWLQLHPEQARARAEAGESELPEEPQPEAEGAAAHGQTTRAMLATVSTNHNAAANFGTPPDDYQGEIQVAANPKNPNQIVAAANTFDNCGSPATGQTQAVFYSSDGGATWGYTCAPGQTDYGLLCNGLSPQVFGSDPALSWDDAGNVYLEYMLVCSTLFGSNTAFAVVVASSADGGVTWSGDGVVKDSWNTSDIEDKNFYAIDRWPESPYHGRHYTCWDRNNNEKSAWSADGGATWHEVDLPSAPTGNGDLGCDLAVDSKGTVHIVFDTLTCTDTCTNEEMYYTRSADGGASWSSPVKVAGFNLVGFSGKNDPLAQDQRGISPFGAIDVDSTGGPCNDTLYATFGDFTANGSNTVENSDVWVSRSTDGGVTWSQRVRVNDDGPDGQIQFHPFLVVDQDTGSVVVAWHDARNDPGTNRNRKVDFYAARSADCGQTFETNVKVSQASSEFNNTDISTSDLNSSENAGANPNQYGEYLGLDVRAGIASLAWTDTRHYFPNFTSEGQKENVGFAQVRFNAMFLDGFETGATTRWSTTKP